MTNPPSDPDSTEPRSPAAARMALGTRFATMNSTAAEVLARSFEVQRQFKEDKEALLQAAGMADEAELVTTMCTLCSGSSEVLASVAALVAERSALESDSGLTEEEKLARLREMIRKANGIHAEVLSILVSLSCRCYRCCQLLCANGTD